MVAQRWDMELYRSTLTMYADTTSILQNQNISPILGWEAMDIMLEQWDVLLLVIIIPPE